MVPTLIQTIFPRSTIKNSISLNSFDFDNSDGINCQIIGIFTRSIRTNTQHLHSLVGILINEVKQISIDRVVWMIRYCSSVNSTPVSSITSLAKYSETNINLIFAGRFCSKGIQKSIRFFTFNLSLV